MQPVQHDYSISRQLRRKTHTSTMMDVSDQARRAFVLDWYQQSDFDAKRALHRMQQHTHSTEIEALLAFKEAERAFEYANEECQTALNLMSHADRSEVLIRQPLREKLAGELELRLARFEATHRNKIHFGVAEWDADYYHGTLSFIMHADMLSNDQNAETLINAALHTIANDDAGIAYSYHLTPTSQTAFTLELTSIIALATEGAEEAAQ